MTRSVLSNALDFRFKDIDLNGVVESWDDNLPIRLASYEYLKRDGGEQEPMGAGVKHFAFRCAFMGPDCGARYRALAESIQQEPRGPLVHPRLGQFNVACAGLRGMEKPAAAIDCIEFTIEFVENQVDQSIQADRQFGPQRRAAQVGDAMDKAAAAVSQALSNRIANTIYAALVTANADLSARADRFRQIALEVAQSQGPDLVLSNLLGVVLRRRDAALSALVAILPKTLEPDISLTDARVAIYLTYAACLQLYQTVLAQKPPIVDFVVPTGMALTTVAVRIYGREAQAKMDSLYALNRIPTPFWVPPGTVLRVEAPQVRQ